MYIGYPTRFETYGAVKIYELSKVHLLFGIGSSSKPGLLNIDSFEDMVKVANTTAIVVPTKDEDPNILDIVLRAIPIYSPIILVSASSQKPLNVYGIEIDLAKTLYRVMDKPIIVVHQRDPIIAEILKDYLPNIVDEDGLIRYGKGEGILIAILLADSMNMKNIGFIDADNYIPGAVLEYTLIYYSVLSINGSRYKMVRVSWGYKAHESTELYLRRIGRVSAIVGGILNKVLSLKRRIETDIIKTSNSGEHAMTMELAKNLVYSSGYSIEVQELVNILEICYMGLDNGLCPSLPQSIEVYQIESRNPHIHSEKGELHIVEMMLESLLTIYYSRLVDEKLKNYILSTIKELGYEGELIPPIKYRYPEINAKAFLDKILSESKYSVAYGV